MASNFLERTARTYKKNVKEGAHRLHEAEQKIDIFGAYKECLDKKTQLSIMFDYADDDGNLKCTDKNGVLIVLRAEDFEKDNSYYSKEIKERFIGTSITVRVSEINEKENTVWVVAAVSKDNIKSALMRGIFDALGKGKHPRLAGDVITVNPDRITVNILHKNILGIMDIKEWAPTFTRNFHSVVHAGEVIEFEVTGQAPRKAGGDIAFTLSRKNIAANPWDSLPEFKPGEIITVKCVDKPKGKNMSRTYWWGTFSQAPGIEIMCDLNPRIRLMEGFYYKCRIRTFDREKRIFQATTFEVSHTGVSSKENIQFLNGKAKHSPKTED